MFTPWLAFNAFLLLYATLVQSNVNDDRTTIGSHEQRGLSKSLYKLNDRETGDLPRKRRNVELQDWMSDDQKLAVKQMVTDGQSPEMVRDKVLHFFDQLPTNVREEWTKKYRELCVQWTNDVATADEIAQLKVLKGGQKYSEKLAEYKQRLPKEKRDAVDLWSEQCNKIISEEHSVAVEHRRRRSLSHSLVDDQLKQLTNDNHMNAKLDDRKNQNSESELKKKCMEWLTEHEQSLAFDKSGDEHLSEQSKSYLEKVTELRELCKIIWLGQMSNRNVRAISDEYNKWIWWMSSNQKSEVKTMRDNGASFDEIHRKMNDHFSKLDTFKQQQLIADYKEKCDEYFSTMANNLEKLSLKATSHAENYEQLVKIVGEIIERQTGQKRLEADKFFLICEKVYEKLQTRTKRDIDRLMEKHLAWLSDAQKIEVKKMKESGKSLDEIKTKLIAFVRDGGAASVKKTKDSCYEWLQEATTGEERAELERMHETNHTACKIKVREYISRLSHEKQEAVNRDLSTCEEVWYGSHDHAHHHSHDHAHHHRKVREAEMNPNMIDEEATKRSEKVADGKTKSKMDGVFKSHLDWLSDEQQKKIAEYENEGKTGIEIQNAVYRFYEQLHGEQKDRANEQLQMACRSLIHEIVGDAKSAQLKAMKESGSSRQELVARVKSLLDEVSDELMRSKIVEYKPICSKIFGAEEHRRLKRHPHETLDEFIEHHLQWLSDAQKVELRKLKTDGKSKLEMHKMVMSAYEELVGESKRNATGELKSACDDNLKDVIGVAHFAELTTLKESGADLQALSAKVNEFLHGISDEAQKLYDEYQPGCRVIYAAVMSDAHHNHSLDDYFKTHLKWLKESERNEVQQMKLEKKPRMEINTKIADYYKHLEGSEKEVATAQMMDGCRHLLEHIIGHEKMTHLRAILEAGATAAEIQSKIEHFIEGVSDTGKTAKINDYRPICSQLVTPLIEKYKKEHHEKHSSEHYFNTSLGWISETQRHELKQMKDDGHPKAEIKAKIFEYYEALSGSEKESATKHLKVACVSLLENVIGCEKVSELRRMKMVGRSGSEIEAKLDYMLSKVTDAEKLVKIKEYGAGCRKVFANWRQYEQDTFHSLSHYFKTSLHWMSEDQKAEVKKMKSEMVKKIFHFYNSLTGLKKEHATKLLKATCMGLVKRTIGESHYNELKHLDQSGVSTELIKAKFDEILSKIGDNSKREKIADYSEGCQQILEHSKEIRKRNEQLLHKSMSEGALKWLNDEQKDHIRRMHAEDKTHQEIQSKVLEFVEHIAEVEKETILNALHDTCRTKLKAIVGEENFEKLKEMKESGNSSTAQMKQTFDHMIEKIDDDDKRRKIEVYGHFCHHIFEKMHKRAKRNSTPEHDIEYYLANHVKWLSDEQKDELRTMYREKKTKSELQEKVLAFLAHAEGAQKKRAIETLQVVCRDLLNETIGAAQMAELKKLRNSGATVEQAKAEIAKMVAKVEDASKKARFAEGIVCARAFDTLYTYRNDAEEYSLEKYTKTYLSWLSEAQSAKLLQMERDGQTKAAIQAEILDNYHLLDAAHKRTAIGQLAEGCKYLIRQVLGADRSDELRAMHASGSSYQQLKAKAHEMFVDISDAAKKQKLADYQTGCEKIFEQFCEIGDSAEHGRHTLERYLNTSMSWLSAEQKAELRKMVDEKVPRVQMHAKVAHYLAHADDVVKNAAVESMFDGCNQIMGSVIGANNSLLLKQLREQGKPYDEILAKYHEFLEQVGDDEHKKHNVTLYQAICEQVYKHKVHATGALAVAHARRKRDSSRTRAWEQQEEEDDDDERTKVARSAPITNRQVDSADYFGINLDWFNPAQHMKLANQRASTKSSQS